MSSLKPREHTTYVDPSTLATRMNVTALLRHIFLDGIPTIMDGVLPLLMASEVSSLLHALGIKREFKHKKKYLNPLRDLDPEMKVLGPMIDSGHTFLMLGDSTEKIIQRILQPAKYWSSGCHRSDYDGGVWTVAIPPNAIELIDEASTYIMHHNVGNNMASWDFKDLMVRRLLKQVWIDDGDVGCMGDEEDWSFDWQCTSHMSINYGGSMYTAAVTVIPEGACDWRPHNITINGVMFHADWKAPYTTSIMDGKTNKFPYIHVSNDPWKVIHTTTAPFPSHLSSVHITFHGEDGKESYIPIF